MVSSASVHHPEPDASRVVYTEVYRLLASAPSDQATGHWRAISPGITQSMTVTSGASGPQVRAVRDPDLSDSQADSGGSIPLTRSTLARSNLKAQVTGLISTAALIL